MDLALELKNVFRTDDGKTYISFLELNKNYQTFKYHPGEETKFTLGPQMLGKELFGEHFEKVTRKLDRAKKETLVKNVVKSTDSKATQDLSAYYYEVILFYSNHL